MIPSNRCLLMRYGCCRAAIKAAWQVFDENGDGTLSLNEMRQVFSSLGVNISEEEVLTMYETFDLQLVAEARWRRFRVADVDASGEIDFGESVNSKLMLNMSVVPDGDTMAGS